MCVWGGGGGGMCAPSLAFFTLAEVSLALKTRALNSLTKAAKSDLVDEKQLSSLGTDS